VTGGTALYDGIIEGIRMTDAAPAAPDAIRGVVVLTDGKANDGQPLDRLVHMISTDETDIRSCDGFEQDRPCMDARGRGHGMDRIVGTGLAMNTQNRIHVFFVGIGDADMEIGRIIAEATGSAYLGATPENLAQVLEQFAKYF
jgi:hypothetical protein